MESVAAKKPADVSEFSTPPGKLPPSTAARLSTKRVSREPTAALAPNVRTSVRLLGPPAVPLHRQPSGEASCRAARPTPPVAAWIIIPSWARMALACCRAICTVTNTVGVPDAASNVRASGLGGIISMLAPTIDARAPGAKPNAPSPMTVPSTLAAHTPAQSAPGGPGSPG